MAAVAAEKSPLRATCATMTPTICKQNRPSVNAPTPAATTSRFERPKRHTSGVIKQPKTQLPTIDAAASENGIVLAGSGLYDRTTPYPP